MNCCRQLLKGKMDNEEVTLQLQEVSTGKATKSGPTGKVLATHHPVSFDIADLMQIFLLDDLPDEYQRWLLNLDFDLIELERGRSGNAILNLHIFILNLLGKVFFVNITTITYLPLGTQCFWNQRSRKLTAVEQFLSRIYALFGEMLRWRTKMHKYDVCLLLVNDYSKLEKSFRNT